MFTVLVTNQTRVRITFWFCPGVPVHKGITIVLSLFRSHWLAVVYCLVLCRGSCVPVQEDRTYITIVIIRSYSRGTRYEDFRAFFMHWLKTESFFAWSYWMQKTYDQFKKFEINTWKRTKGWTKYRKNYSSNCARLHVFIILIKSKCAVRSGIRTHAYKSRLRPERSALDRSAILTCTLP